jgi:hypothetical protein
MIIIDGKQVLFDTGTKEGGSSPAFNSPADFFSSIFSDSVSSTSLKIPPARFRRG